MQTAKDQIADHSVGESPTATPIKLADAEAAAKASPAAQLQAQLHRSFDPVEADDKWSYRRTATFLMVTCGGFWAGVAGLVAHIF